MSNFNIKGVDISNNNSINDLSTLKNNGVEYIYLKATEGATFVDSFTTSRYTQAKSLGLKVGFYHFLVSTSTPESQAENAYNATKNYNHDLVFMLDIETNFSSLCDYVLRFINKWQELSDIEIGIYTYSSFISNLSSISNYIESRKLWIANYTFSYSNVNIGFFNSVVGWQYTENGTIGSFTGDCNYFNENCLANESKTGKWILDNTGWWYKHSDGSYTKDGWEKIENRWYLFDSRGYMLYGWQYSSGANWYYLGNSDDGSMKTGWVLTNNKWYYLNSDGAMQVGWQKINNEWYYFDNSGAMQTGWIKDNGKDYLLYSNGAMAHDCELYGYTINGQGVASKIE